MTDVFDRLDPRVQKWVWQQGWQNLNTLQRNAITPILERNTDVLLSAPTAGGKTEAAFLPVITDLLAHGGTALMISPLKSLINDQTRRLGILTCDMDLPVTPWHGDAPQGPKEAVLRHPGGIVIITPESLESLLDTRCEKAGELLRSLRYVIIDELHVFLGSERGIQLQSLLQRMGRPEVPRIALSATLGSVENASAFLRPNRELPVVTPEAGASASQVRLAIKEFIANDNHRPEDAIAADMFERLRGTSNLVFTNSRKDAEAYAVALSKLSEDHHVPDEFRIHHGSLSKDDRHAVERDLQRGHLPVTAICTASMELGVDIGDVASVAQAGTAISPSTLRQRLGRSGRREAPPVLRIYSIDEQRDDYKYHLRVNLLQNIAVTEMLCAGTFDTPLPPEAFLSIAVQQLLGLLGQFGSLNPASAYEMLCRKGPFGMLNPDDFANLLRHLHGKGVISQLGSGALVVGDAGEKIVAKRDFLSAFTAAPDYSIIDNATQKTIGSVQYKPYYGEVFILGGRTWIVDGVEEKSFNVYVGQTEAKGKMMFEGTGPETTQAVCRRMKSILEDTATYPYLDTATGSGRHLEEARRWYRRKGLDTQPWLSQADRPVYLTWGGMRSNRALALMAYAELGISVSYDHLAVTGIDETRIDRLKALLPATPEEARAYLAQLASHVSRAKKQRGKFDIYLPDQLLDRQYAAARLDIPLLPHHAAGPDAG